VQLEEVDGIGPGRRQKIKAAWAEQKAVRDIMIFLHSNGVSTSRAVRIYKVYGENAIETVRANPYTLAKDIHGIGFKSADTVAQKLGIARDSMIRALAGIMHALMEATGEGHCALPKESLIEQAAKLLEIDVAIVREALERLLLDSELVQEPIGVRQSMLRKRLPGASKRQVKSWQRHSRRRSGKRSNRACW
jgi:exodeoxyribonuclease V alpha subunit